MDKKKIILGAIVLLSIAIIIVISSIYLTKQKEAEKEPLYRDSYSNAAWGFTSYGYIIYKNGYIEQYDNSDKYRKNNLKKAQLTSNELKQLLQLASEVSDNFEKNNSFMMQDAGTHIKQIYNQKEDKWIVLSKSGDSNGSNNTDVAKKILKLTGELEKKYLK